MPASAGVEVEEVAGTRLSPLGQTRSLSKPRSFGPLRLTSFRRFAGGGLLLWATNGKLCSLCFSPSSSPPASALCSSFTGESRGDVSFGFNASAEIGWIRSGKPGPAENGWIMRPG